MAGTSHSRLSKGPVRSRGPVSGRWAKRWPVDGGECLAACAVWQPAFSCPLSRNLAPARPDICYASARGKAGRGPRDARESAKHLQPCHASPSRRNRYQGVTFSGVRRPFEISMTNLPCRVFIERCCTPRRDGMSAESLAFEGSHFRPSSSYLPTRQTLESTFSFHKGELPSHARTFPASCFHD